MEESWELHHNPAAGALWTPADVNAGMEFGLRPPRVTQAYVQVTYRVATESTVYIGGVYERKGDGSVTKYYAALGRVIALRQVPEGGGGGTLSWLLADHLGSAVGVLDAGGALVPGSKQQYWPYGATRSGGVTQTDKLYTGQQQEPGDAALGLYNYKARFYSTVVGRFVSADPTVPSSRPISVNRYAYVNNNPLSWTDPTGYDPTQQDYENCSRNVIACLWWSAGGDAERYINLVAEWFAISARVLAAIILNEIRSRDWRDDLTEPVGSACAYFGISFCSNASYGIAQMKLSKAKTIERIAPEFRDLVHDDRLVIARLKHPLWAIAYAAALLREYKQNLFTTDPAQYLRHVVSDADYIVAYQGDDEAWKEWMGRGGCDTCGEKTPRQIFKGPRRGGQRGEGASGRGPHTDAESCVESIA